MPVGSEYDRINRLAERAQKSSRAAASLQAYLDKSVEVEELEAAYRAKLAAIEEANRARREG